jgi:hypothetical protein
MEEATEASLGTRVMEMKGGRASLEHSQAEPGNEGTLARICAVLALTLSTGQPIV